MIKAVNFTTKESLLQLNKEKNHRIIFVVEVFYFIASEQNIG